MGLDQRLSRLAHGLIHMSYYDGTATSNTLAKMFDTNPVVVRRMMAGLRKNNIVDSQKGHGGGWVLDKKLEDISLLDIYESLGDTNLMSISMNNQQTKCLVEQSVNEALEQSIKQAKALLFKKFSQISLASIAQNLEDKMQNQSCKNLSNPPSGNLSANTE